MLGVSGGCPQISLSQSVSEAAEAVQDQGSTDRGVVRGSHSFWVKRHDLFQGRGKLRARVLGESQHRLPPAFHHLISAGDFPHPNAVGCFMLLKELQRFFLSVAECENQVFRPYSAPGPMFGQCLQWGHAHVTAESRCLWSSQSHKNHHGQAKN